MRVNELIYNLLENGGYERGFKTDLKKGRKKGKIYLFFKIFFKKSLIFVKPTLQNPYIKMV